MGKYDELVERLKAQAESASRASIALAEAKSARQGDNPEGALDLYEWLLPAETIEWQAAAAIATLEAELETLRPQVKVADDQWDAKCDELAAMKARGEELDRPLPQEHWTTKGAIRSARELIKAADALCFAAETSGGTAGHDGYLSAAIANWAAEREKHKQVLRIIELEGHSPEIGAGVPTNLFAKP